MTVLEPDVGATLADLAVAASCPDCGTHLDTRLGVDAQSVAAVLRSLTGPLRGAYLARVYTAREIADCGVDRVAPATAAASLAARFAAKEATLKVLRPGDRASRWSEIEVVREAGGWTRLVLHGDVARFASRAGLTAWSCSLSHDAGFGVAAVLALRTHGEASDVHG